MSEAIREGASSQELFHAVTAASNLGVDLDAAKVLRATQMALKKDDSVLRCVTNDRMRKECHVIQLKGCHDMELMKCKC